MHSSGFLCLSLLSSFCFFPSLLRYFFDVIIPSLVHDVLPSFPFFMSLFCFSILIYFLPSFLSSFLTFFLPFLASSYIYIYIHIIPSLTSKQLTASNSEPSWVTGDDRRLLSTPADEVLSRLSASWGSRWVLKGRKETCQFQGHLCKKYPYEDKGGHWTACRCQCRPRPTVPKPTNLGKHPCLRLLYQIESINKKSLGQPCRLQGRETPKANGFVSFEGTKFRFAFRESEGNRMFFVPLNVDTYPYPLCPSRASRLCCKPCSANQFAFLPMPFAAPRRGSIAPGAALFSPLILT